jgi:hypothetical protein
VAQLFVRIYYLQIKSELYKLISLVLKRSSLPQVGDEHEMIIGKGVVGGRGMKVKGYCARYEKFTRAPPPHRRRPEYLNRKQ